MGATAYTVTAIISSEKLVTDYISWLRDGHVQAVIEGGAVSAQIVRIVDPAHPVRVETRYMFKGPEEFARYCTESAPALRAQGKARFGAVMSFVRSVGEVLWEAPAIKN